MGDDVVRVECYSGSIYAEEPRALFWEGKRHTITTVLQRWRTPTQRYFRVRTTGNELFDVSYDEIEDTWQINFVL